MKIAVAFAVAMLTTFSASADRNPLETVDQARQRQSAENYESHKRQDNPLLPPSYSRPLGDTEQRGVDRPGYVAPAPTYRPQPTYQPGYGGGSWQDRAKGR